MFTAMQNSEQETAFDFDEFDMLIPETPFDYEQENEAHKQQILDLYEQSLIVAFQQVEELKRLKNSRKVGTCTCSTSSSSSLSRSSSLCVRKSGGACKRSGYRKRTSKATSSANALDLKDGDTFDGLMLAIDKFLTD